MLLSLLEFIDIDRNIPIEDFVNDQEIIDLVLQGDDEASDMLMTKKSCQKAFHIKKLILQFRRR